MTSIPTKTAQELRHRAEELFRVRESLITESASPEETKRLFHELWVHQIELEMQNEELCRTHEELDASQSRYFDLYDLAPVGYLTIGETGLIKEVNLTAAAMLGVERSVLIEQPLNRIIFKDDQDMYYLSQQQSRNSNTPNIMDVRLVKSNGSHFWAHMQLTTEQSVENWITFTDITERKMADESLRVAMAEIHQLKNRLQAENLHLQKEIAQQFNFGEIIGESDAIKRVFNLAQQVAPMNATVLLLGETGTGKGVLAQAIHDRSVRKGRPMITVNCTVLPESLIESELFGREKGAFTGAHARQIGRFELADGGTIFLDEIGELSFELQKKLLRVIQDGEFERLGSPHTIKVDVRIIAATNRNLEEELRMGRFREDLFYRLNVFPINIPPLRQRVEDIPLLVNHFVAKFNKKIGKKIDNVSTGTLSVLRKYLWPGNVRELESVIERSVIISQGSALQVPDLLDSFCKAEESDEGDVKALALLEQDHIIQVLQKTGWRIDGTKGAALLLGINPSTLRSRMRKYGIIRG
ncbi:MAG: sigma 54-interacting transcriptional regulator [Desulfuromonadales bacterium]